MHHRRLLAAGLALAAALLAPAGADAKTCPNIMFVLDQSSSMAEDVNGVKGNHPTKFELLQQSVTDILNQYGDRVPFGVLLFYADNVFPGKPASDPICLMDAESSLMMGVKPPGPDLDRSISSNKIIQIVKAAAPISGSHTNTGDAIITAAMDSSLHDKQRPNYIVLVTDGVPSCNSEDLMMLSQTGSATYTVARINDARNLTPSVKTVVVGFDGSGTGVDKNSLDEFAQAGGAPIDNCGNGTPCYYSASDPTKFKAALAKVIDSIAGGEFGNQYCDDSCFSSGCPPGQRCAKGELDPAPHCEPDQCQGHPCSGNTFCRDGQCINACSDGCKSGQRCIDGACVPDPCAAVTCDAMSICCPLGVPGCADQNGNPVAPGTCVPDYCAARMCAPHTVCENGSGKCIEDRCSIITCPANTKCSSPDGNCVSQTVRNGGNKCAVEMGAAPGSPIWFTLLLGLCGLALLARRLGPIARRNARKAGRRGTV